MSNVERTDAKVAHGAELLQDSITSVIGGKTEV
jgi:hypothetical protein